MDPDSELKALELRLLSVIESRDASVRVALEKVNLRLDQHRGTLRVFLSAFENSKRWSLNLRKNLKT
jgi:hypothetical protein